MNNRKTRVVLLGTGNPNPDPYHQGPSVAVIAGDKPYIFDFGTGLIRQVAALTPRWGGDMQALEAKNLKKAFLSHLHSDHTIGYPDLILTPWIMGRDEPLEDFGPVGTKKLTQQILKAYQDDINYRLVGLEPANSNGWKVYVHEFSDGFVYKDENIQVEPFSVQHGTLQNSYGFHITTRDTIFVISGDTAPCDNIRKYGDGADILIHEVYYHAGLSRKSQAWINYHKTHHTSTVELARLASDLQPGLLVTYHTLFWGATEQDIRDEITYIYSGPILIGRDMQVVI